jgi:hypothetical protein
LLNQLFSQLQQEQHTSSSNSASPVCSSSSGVSILPAAVAALTGAVQLQRSSQRVGTAVAEAAKAAAQAAAALNADAGNAQKYNATEVSMRACSCLRRLMIAAIFEQVECAGSCERMFVSDGGHPAQPWPVTPAVMLTVLVSLTNRNGMNLTAAVVAFPLLLPLVLLHMSQVASAGDKDSLRVSAHVLVATAAGLPPGAVADTTGAGDAFIGSVMYGITTGMTPEQILRLGAVVAACKCTMLGARPGLPRRDQLAAQLLGVDI